MDTYIENFYVRSTEPNYFLKYESQHGKRLDFVVDRFKLGELKNKFLADFGCGYGFLFRRLDQSNTFVGFDGAKIDAPKAFVRFLYLRVDLNEPFADNFLAAPGAKFFDYSFCFETLEHLENPYRCILEMKKVTKPKSYIYLSIPHERMRHNTGYPGLFYPSENFDVFLKQMALRVEDKVLYDADWPSWIYKCQNLPMTDSELFFPKDDPIFYGKHPIECTNI